MEDKLANISNLISTPWGLAGPPTNEGKGKKLKKGVRMKNL